MAVSQTLSVTDVSTSDNITANTSKVRILWKSTQTGESWNGYTKTAKYYISINGGAETEYSVSYTLPQNATQTIVDKTITVTHKDDGTGSVKVRTWMDTGISAGVVEKTQTLTLTTRPRASTLNSLSCETKYFTGKMTYRYTPKSSLFYNQLRIGLKVGANFAIVKTINLGKKSASIQTATVSLSDDVLALIYESLPQTTKGTLRFYLATYSDSGYSKSVGDTSNKEIDLYIPFDSTTKPSVSMALAPVSSLSSPFSSLYIQGYSKVKATITAKGQYEADIISTTMTVGSTVYDSEDSYTSGYLTGSGAVTVKVKTVDSRGYYNETTKDIDVIPYSKPRMLPASGESEIICARCDAQGNITESGAYLKIQAKREYSKVQVDGEQKNFCTLRYQYKKVTDSGYSSWKTILADNTLSKDEVITTQLDGRLSEKSSYIVRVGVVDTLGNQANATFEIPTDKVYMHRAGSRNSLAFGKYVEKDNTIEVAKGIALELGGNKVDAIVSTDEGDITGSIRFASGFVMQWGSVTVTPLEANTPTASAVTFDIPYKNTPFVVTSPVSEVPGTTLLGTSASNMTIAGFDVVLTRTNTTSTKIRWLAIGFC